MHPRLVPKKCLGDNNKIYKKRNVFWSFPHLEIIYTHTFRHGKASKTHPRLVTSSNEENSFTLGQVVFAIFFIPILPFFHFIFFFYPFLFLLIKHVNQETIFFFLKEEKNEEHIDVGRRFD